MCAKSRLSKGIIALVTAERSEGMKAQLRRLLKGIWNALAFRFTLRHRGGVVPLKDKGKASSQIRNDGEASQFIGT